MSEVNYNNLHYWWHTLLFKAEKPHQGCSHCDIERGVFFFATRGRALLMKMISTKGNRKQLISPGMHESIFFSGAYQSLCIYCTKIILYFVDSMEWVASSVVCVTTKMSRASVSRVWLDPLTSHWANIIRLSFI